MKLEFTLEQIESFIEDANRYDLDGRSILHLYSIGAIKENFNGIGPDKMNENLRWFFTVIGWRYMSAVIIHDMDYTKGGTIDDFHKSNRRLRRNLRKILDRLYHRWNPWYWVEYLSINIICRICETAGWEGFHKI